MKKLNSIFGLIMFFAVLSVFNLEAAESARSSSARVGMTGMGRARAPQNFAQTQSSADQATDEGGNSIVEVASNPAATDDTQVVAAGSATVPASVVASAPVAEVVAANSETCREAYRGCMDQFCLLDESEGQRCACSDAINSSKSLIKKINDTQAEAEKLYSEGVEREKLGAKAVLVFGSSAKAKASRVDLSAWLNSSDGLDYDEDIGGALHSMASESCASKLSACGKDANMEEMLYGRQISNDCRAFSVFLADQQKIADSNKASAEQAVRAARLAMLGDTNKYNRGECLIALRNCVAEKGGCGDNFENCLDEGLLTRRTNACENITDQCMAVKDSVMQDWKDEMVLIMEDAVKYADKYKRQTCLARIESCLEGSCSTATNDQCLNNVRVAEGVCPVITECNQLIPGITATVNDKLGYLRVRFCQNDIESCFRDKCGADYTKPECLGKGVQEIAKLCPQSMYPSCRGQEQFNVLVQGVFLKMDYAMMQGCVNKFSEDLGRVCGTDMSCIPEDPAITNLKSVDEAQAMFALDPTSGDIKWKQYASAEVDKFFASLEQDSTIGACADTQNPKTKVAGRNSVGRSVFNTAKLLAKIQAENRQYRSLVSKMRELAKAADVAEARKACEMMKGDKIDSAVFEPDLRNCHICRTQEVCEEGGESKATSALKAASGGLAAGASAGTMVSPGWGTAIGGVVGAVGAGIMGGLSGGKKTFCQEIQSCEDVNM